MLMESVHLSNVLTSAFLSAKKLLELGLSESVAVTADKGMILTIKPESTRNFIPDKPCIKNDKSCGLRLRVVASQFRQFLTPGDKETTGKVCHGIFFAFTRLYVR